MNENRFLYASCASDLKLCAENEIKIVQAVQSCLLTIYSMTCLCRLVDSDLFRNNFKKKRAHAPLSNARGSVVGSYSISKSYLGLGEGERGRGLLKVFITQVAKMSLLRYGMRFAMTKQMMISSRSHSY